MTFGGDVRYHSNSRAMRAQICTGSDSVLAVVTGCLGLRGSLAVSRGADLRYIRSSLRALVPLSQQLEGEDARVVIVVPGELESPGTVQFSVLDTKR
jgi:hypothetical protein